MNRRNVLKFAGSAVLGLVLAFGTLARPAFAQSRDMIIFAAASLKTALDEIAARWQSDGNRAPKGLNYMAETLIGGDAIEPAIMAASILAKVSRDRMMVQLHAAFPQYGFDQHKGYPTSAHLSALAQHGPCVHHRRSFAPVREALDRR